MKSKQGMLQTTIILYFLQIATMILSFARSSIFAYFFGTTWQADAYNVALKVPTVLFAVVATAIKTVTIPLYSKQLYENDKEKADHFYSNLMSIVVIVAVIFSGVCCVLSKEVVLLFAPGLDTEPLNLASKLTKIFSISIAMLSVVNIQDGILNVYKKYTYAKVSSEIAIVVRILFLVILAGSIGVYAAVLGFMIGTFCSLLMSSFGTRKVAKYRFTLDLKDKTMRLALKSSIPVFLGVGLAEINRIIDGAIASYMDSGSISALNYASTLETAIVSLCITIINTIYYPIIAKEVSQKNTESLCKTYNLVMSILMYISLPIFFGGLVMRKDIVSVVYYRGAFTAENVTIVSVLFAIYLIGILFVGIRHTASNVLYAMTDTKTPMINSSIGVVVNIVLNIVLGHLIGVYGLALATAVSMITATIFMIWSTTKKIPALSLKPFFSSIVKGGSASLLMAAVVFLIDPRLSMSLYPKCFLRILIGAVVYFAVLVIMRVEELQELMTQLKKRFLKKGERE